MMSWWLIFALLTRYTLGIYQSYSFNSNRLGSYNHFVKVPKNGELIQTGGRLIDRHLGYLYEAGFAAVLSISDFPTNDTVYNGVPGSYPSSDYEMAIVESYGMKGKTSPSALTVDSAKEISQVISEMPKPLYIHCHVGYTANLFLQMHLYLTNQIKSEEIYSHSLSIGYDYQNNSDVVQLLNSLTGRHDTPQPAQLELTLTEGEQSYRNYYWPHRLGQSDYWYNIGQILQTQVSAIASAGYRVVISFRDNGESTTLLPDETSNTFIPNFEFSDATGNYDVQAEQSSVESWGMKFIHLPLVSSASITWTKEEFDLYYPTLKSVADAKVPSLVHCASGYRSSAFILTFLAYEEKFCSDWALSQAAEIGFVFNSENPTSTDEQVVSFMKDVLGC